MRRLLALTRGLPANSAFHREVDPDGSHWNTTHELLALLVEVVDYGNRLFLSANSKKGTQIPEPIRVPRPYDKTNVEPPRPQMADSTEVKSFFRKGRR